MTAALVTTSLPTVVESFAGTPLPFIPGTRCLGCAAVIRWEPYDDAGTALVNGALVRPGCWTCPDCYRTRRGDA